MSTESNHSSIENLDTITLNDGSKITYKLEKAPVYIWRVDTEGVPVASGYHYAWKSEQEASYRALIDGNVNDGGNKSLLQGVAKKSEDGLIYFREVDTSRKFSSSFGQYELRKENRQNCQIMNLTFEKGFNWMNLKDQVQSWVSMFRQKNVIVIGFKKVLDNSDDTIEFNVDFGMYQRKETVRIELIISN